jgi:ribosomal protein L11 methyltransferase
MYVLAVECPRREKDLLLAELWERGTDGVSEEDLPGERCRLRAFFPGPFDAAFLSDYSPVWDEEPVRDWTAGWRETWQPFELGRRWFLVPDWREDPPPPGRIRLPFHPGMAFGTGADGTTQLCLEALEKHLTIGDCVVDLGTGTGILAHGALLLGASRVVACDIDAEVAAQARRNLPAEIGVFHGSSRAVRSGCAGLLVANINAETVFQVAAEMRRIVRPGGKLILSGFPLAGESEVAAKFQVEERTTRSGWACLVCYNP